jgi:hypothetical protein
MPLVHIRSRGFCGQSVVRSRFPQCHGRSSDDAPNPPGSWRAFAPRLNISRGLPALGPLPPMRRSGRRYKKPWLCLPSFLTESVAERVSRTSLATTAPDYPLGCCCSRLRFSSKNFNADGRAVAPLQSLGLLGVRQSFESGFEDRVRGAGGLPLSF